MPRIVTKPDNLNELNRNFAQVPLKEPVFLNSVPKSGTHLIRNIMRMFVPVEQQYHKAFIQYAVLRDHQAAFARARPCLSWGHMLYGDASAVALRGVHHLVLVRDPYDWVLARARFFLSDTYQGSLDIIKGGNLSIENILNMMIFGIPDKSPALYEIFTLNAAAWLGTDAKILQFEELLKNVKAFETDAAEAFFAGLFEQLNMGELPDDWRERIRVGADRKQSTTARENLSHMTADVPDELPDIQKRLVDYAAPGLRAILGYT